MLNELSKDDLFHVFYREWIAVYKEGAVRQVTLNKYMLALGWLEKLAPDLKLSSLDRIAYQNLLNQYAKEHERQTTMDFHHLLKGAILDAVDEGLVSRDPTRKAIVKGKTPRPKKNRYLNQFELHKLLASLDLGQDIGWEWFILLVAKTGLRFSSASGRSGKALSRRAGRGSAARAASIYRRRFPAIPSANTAGFPAMRRPCA